MRAHNAMESEEALEAGRVAARGAGIGALNWGIPFVALGLVGHRFHPLYRSFTIQFKTFIQIGGMTMGACIEAEKTLRDYEDKMRIQRQLAKDKATWDAYDREFGKEEDY